MYIEEPDQHWSMAEGADSGKVTEITLGGKFFTHGELNLNTSREKRKGKRERKKRGDDSFDCIFRYPTVSSSLIIV
jgi:hypothetical protein